MTSPHESSSASAAGQARVSPHLGRAFGGVWRLTFPKLFAPGNALLLGVTLVLLGAVGLIFINSDHRIRSGDQLYLEWIIGFQFTFLVPVMAFISAAGAIRDDMKSGTVDYVLTRPVPRPAYVVFKYVAHVVGSQAQLLLASGVLVAFGLVRHAPGVAAALPMLLLGQVLLVLAFSAFGFFCGVLTSRYVVIGLVYGAIVEVGVGQIPTQLSRLSMTHQVKSMLLAYVPGREAGSTAAALVSVTSPSTTCLFLVVFALVLVALATAVFSLRELSTANEA